MNTIFFIFKDIDSFKQYEIVSKLKSILSINTIDRLQPKGKRKEIQRCWYMIIPTNLSKLALSILEKTSEIQTSKHHPNGIILPEDVSLLKKTMYITKKFYRKQKT